MAKPKAARWLTEAFRDGVDLSWTVGQPCWLAQHDPARQPCSGPIERFHFIPRQRVENALGALLPLDAPCWVCFGTGRQDAPETESGEVECGTCEGSGYLDWPRADLILLAAWDPRNGGLGCEHHHRRFDGHATSPRAPKIVVPFPQLPEHVFDYVDDYGFRGAGWLTERFPA